MLGRAGDHLDFIAANDLVGERRRGFVERAACLALGAYLSVSFSLVFAGAVAGGCVLIVQAISIFSKLIRWN